MEPVLAIGVTSPQSSRRGSSALVAPALMVVAVAAAFDVLAVERPHRTLSLVLVAAAVGTVRWLLRGRLRGLFSLINLAVVAQPVAHGVGELTHAPTGLVPHSHVVPPKEFSSLAVQIAVATLVAVVAGSEPIAVFVASTVVAVAAALARRPFPETSAPAVRPAPRERDPVPVGTDAAVQCRPHRGPPALVGLAV